MYKRQVKQPHLRLTAWDTRSGYEEPRNELQLQPPFTAREYFGEDYEECCEGMLAVTWSLGTKAGFEECRALGFNSKYDYELYKKLEAPRTACWQRHSSLVF